MTRPRFASTETVRNESHQAANHSNQRRCDLQPFGAAYFFATHQVWTDVENRKHDRYKHRCRCQCCKPRQHSNTERLLHVVCVTCNSLCWCAVECNGTRGREYVIVSRLTQTPLQQTASLWAEPSPRQ